MTPPATPHARLRAATAAAHAEVDAAFGRFDLAGREGYTAFLTAHARALPAVEAVLADMPGLPAFRPRAPLLVDDLAQLGGQPPHPFPLTIQGGTAGAWGALYVIEGSRLGGGLLARAVSAGLPRSYLSATHHPGEWRTFLARYDAAADGPGWEDQALASARAIFGLYARAAAM